MSAGNVTDKYNNLVIPEQRDSCQIYAVLYETDDNVECLFGDNVLTSPNIVAKAVVPTRSSRRWEPTFLSTWNSPISSGSTRKK